MEGLPYEMLGSRNMCPAKPSISRTMEVVSVVVTPKMPPNQTTVMEEEASSKALFKAR